MRKWEKGQRIEGGMRTRRRPIGRDYAAAKDVEVGILKSEGGMRKSEAGPVVVR
jgi:hypothetical protein